MHDRWATYFIYDNFVDALCGAHLLRDLQFIIDAHDQRWPKRMKKLLLQASREVAKSDGKVLTNARFKSVRKQYRTILTQGKKELPAPLERTGKRGKVAQTDAQNLHDAFVKYENEILRFTRNPYVGFTTNIAERSFRMSKAKQNVADRFMLRSTYKAEGLRLFSFGKICRSFLPRIKLPANNEFARLQPAHCNPDRTQKPSGKYPLEQRLKYTQPRKRFS